MYSNGILKVADPLDDLDLIAAALAKLADLVWESDNEDYLLTYGVAIDALRNAKKERQLSYEDRNAPHQYYYPEDLRTNIEPLPKREELSVPQMEVTTRGDTGTNYGR